MLALALSPGAVVLSHGVQSPAVLGALRRSVALAFDRSLAPRPDQSRSVARSSCLFLAVDPRLSAQLTASSAQPPRDSVVGTRFLPLWRPPQPPWDARLCCSLSMFTCFVSMYGCLCVYCMLRPFLAFSCYGAQPWCSPAIILSAQSALVLGARLLGLSATLQLIQGDPPLKRSASDLGQDTLALGCYGA